MKGIVFLVATGGQVTVAGTVTGDVPSAAGSTTISEKSRATPGSPAARRASKGASARTCSSWRWVRRAGDRGTGVGAAAGPRRGPLVPRRLGALALGVLVVLVAAIPLAGGWLEALLVLLGLGALLLMARPGRRLAEPSGRRLAEADRAQS